MLSPPSTLLIGPGGTGKTTSIVTLLAEGLNVRMIATEPSAPNRVLEECKKRNVSDARFDWCFVSPSPPKWQTLIDSANTVNLMSLKDIADMKGGIAKQDGKQWIKLLNNLANFTSDRTGVALGDATEWGPDTALVIDGLTGVSTMSRNLTVGLKPNPAPGEWEASSALYERCLRQTCGNELPMEYSRYRRRHQIRRPAAVRHHSPKFQTYCGFLPR